MMGTVSRPTLFRRMAWIILQGVPGSKKDGVSSEGKERCSHAMGRAV